MVTRFFTRIDEYLSGWPDEYLTWLLLLVAGVAVLVAMFGRPIIKAAVAAWLIFP